MVLKATNHTSHTCYTNIIAFVSVVSQMHNFFLFFSILELIQFYCHSPFLIRYAIQTIHNWLHSSTFQVFSSVYYSQKHSIHGISLICSFIGNTFGSINATVLYRTPNNTRIFKYYTSNIHIPSYQSFFLFLILRFAYAIFSQSSPDFAEIMVAFYSSITRCLTQSVSR